jgi:hypothetical protein
MAVATDVTDDNGETCQMPFIGTFPSPGSMVTLVAFWVAMLSVAD